MCDKYGFIAAQHSQGGEEHARYRTSHTQSVGMDPQPGRVAASGERRPSPTECPCCWLSRLSPEYRAAASAMSSICMPRLVLAVSVLKDVTVVRDLHVQQRPAQLDAG